MVHYSMKRRNISNLINHTNINLYRFVHSSYSNRHS